MRPNQFWLSDQQWRQIEPHLPKDVRGKPRVDDRRVISGIVHVIKSGCRWCDCPPEYGPPTTIYNRFVRWARRGIWERLFRELSARGRSTETQMIDATHVKAHRSASGAKRGSRAKRLDARVAGAIQKSTQSRMLRAVFFHPADRRSGARLPAGPASDPTHQSCQATARRQSL
jgi:transposase